MKGLLIILLMLIYSAIQATTYKIGSDQIIGQRTIEDANTVATSLVSGDSLLFHCTETFYGVFELPKSGTFGSEIVVGRYGTGANPIITGFTSITSWTNLGSNLWESTSSISTLSSCNMVSVADVNTQMGREPEAGNYYTFQSHSGSTSITSSDLTGSPDWTGAELVIRSLRYKWDRRIIASQSGGTLNWATNTISAPVDGRGFLIQNDIRTLDQQNEWFYNSNTKKITVYSTSQPIGVNVASTENIITINGDFITIENIDFIGANKSCIYSASSTLNNINIKNCNFNFSGKGGITFKADYLTIQNCSIFNSNDMAVNIYGSNHVNITNNTIQNNAIYPGMIPTETNGWAAMMVGGINSMNIEYNKVVNSGYNGISYGGSTNSKDSTIIKNNIVDTFCSIMDDGGGIYGGQNSILTGNIVINGIGANIGAGSSTSGGQAIGIYFDRNSNNCEVYGNTVANCAYNGFLLNNPSNINIHDNIVYNSTDAQIRFNNFSGYNAIVGNTVSQNILVSRSSQYTINFYSFENNIPTLVDANSNYYARPIDDNSTIRINQPSTGAVNYTLAQWQTFSGQDINSQILPQSITDDSVIRFEYNATGSTVIIPLSVPMIDMKGVKYPYNITLQPFTSAVLIPDNNPDLPPRSIMKNGKWTKSRANEIIMTR